MTYSDWCEVIIFVLLSRFIIKLVRFVFILLHTVHLQIGFETILHFGTKPLV